MSSGRTGPGEERSSIREEDVRSRSIRRRAFLERFGVAAGMTGLLGLTAGCERTDSCDADEGDPIMADSDQVDEPVVDADAGDPCDADGVGR